MPARNSSMELSSPLHPEVPSQKEPDRRKSGRAAKPPEYLFPSGSNTKRKRDARTEDDDESITEDESDEGDGEESEQAPERPRRKTKVGNTVQNFSKRARPNGISGSLPVRPAVASKPKKAKKGARLTDASAGGLYARIFAADDTLDDVAAEWLRRFGEHQANALTEIVNLLLRCSGCRIEVSVYDVQDPDNAANKLTELQEEYQAQNITEYPLIAKNKSAAVFKKTLTGFFDSLIKSIATSALLYNDPDLIENLHIWVASMSSAANRPFRHTATVVAFSIISAISEVGKGLINTRAKLLRQVEGEQKRTKVNKKRIQDLNSEAKQTDAHIAQLDTLIRDWNDTIFVHRYRDVIPAIRVDSIIYLTDWIMTHPDHFFDVQHLRYLGWLLADEDKSSRHEVIKQLQRIYHDKSKIAGLQHFTERFRPRMIEMATRDKETNVRASAVELLEILRDAGLLEPDDIDTIGKLVYDAEPLVRKAVVPFVVASIDEILASKLDDLGGQEALEELPTQNEGDFESLRPEWLTFKTLGELLQSFDPESGGISNARGGPIDDLVAAPTEVESRFSFATQAIFQKFPDLTKWELLAGYLLFDHSPAKNHGVDFESRFKELCKLGEREEIILLDVLNTSVKMTLTEAVDDEKEKTKKSKKHTQLLLEKQEESAQRLGVIIPKLLTKFGAAPEAASAVLRLERMLNLEVFQELRQDSTTFAALLDDIKKQFMTHDNSLVLVQASAALNHANSFEALGELTAERMQTIWEDSTYALISHCRGEDLTVRGGMDANVLEAIAATMLRISTLARVSNCIDALETPQKYVPPKVQRKQHKDAPVAPVDLMLPMLGRGRPGPHMDTEVNETEDNLVLNVIQSLLYYFLWHAQGLQKQTALPVSRKSDLTALADKRAAVSTQLHSIIAERHGADAVRVAAAELLLDIHTIFVDKSNTEPKIVQQLAAKQLTQQQQSDIIKVLTAAEKDYASKSNRKLEGPGEDDDPEDSDDDSASSSVAPNDYGAQDADEETSQKRRARADEKQKGLLVAEYRLCELAAKIVRAIIAGVVDRPLEDGSADAAGDTPKSMAAGYEGPVRRRLIKNRGKLGPNFKGVIEALERNGLPRGAKNATGTKRRANGKRTAAVQNAGKAKKAAKSRETVEEESDGDEDVRMGDEIEDDDEDALRRNGLVVDDVPDVDDGAAGPLEDSEAESVIGD